MEELTEVLNVGVPLVLGGGLALALMVYVVMTAILWYHWSTYAVSKELVGKVIRIYAVLSVIFIGTALIASGVYFLSLPS